jgi:hypothetical protein
MGQIVRRVKRQAQQDGYSFEDTTEHHGEGLWIEVHRRIDFNPMVRIEWRRLSGYGRITLKLFRSSKGFCPEDRPEDLTKHGEMILESVKNGEIEQHLSEGTYFYTFQFCQPVLFGLSEKLSRPIRFTVEVPSLETALKRVGDWQKLEEMQHQQGVRQLTREAERAEAVISLSATTKRLLAACADEGERGVKKLVQDQIGRIKERIDLELGLTEGRDRLLTELQASDAFKSMPKAKQKRLVKLVGDELDTDEQAFQP